MPRTADRPWFRAARKQWYATVDKKKVPLGVFGPENEAAALAAFNALVQHLQANKPEPPAPEGTVAEAVELFLYDLRGEVKDKTISGLRQTLSHFLALYGTDSLASFDRAKWKAVERDARAKKWSDNTVRNYLVAVEQCLKHAGMKVSLRKPDRTSAGPESVIPEKVYWQVLGACRRHDLRKLTEFLWHTGCRPGEARSLTADMVDFSSGTCRLREHKTRGRTGKDRLIYLSPDAMAILKAQAIRHGGEGHLFRGAGGGAFSMQALVSAYWRISDRIGHRVTAYCFRHTYATRALERGVPDTHVAALLGHTSTAMIHRHYSHLTSNARLLREAAGVVSAAG